MTKIIHKILHIFNIIIVTLIILLTSVLSLLHLATPYLQEHKQQVENWVTDFLHQPVTINTINVGQYGLEPVIKFKDITILNKDKSETLLKVEDLRIGIDLIGSLIKWKITPGLLFVKGADLNFTKDKDGNIFVNDTLIEASTAKQQVLPIQEPSNITSKKTYELFNWLFTQGRVILRDINFTWNENDEVVFKSEGLAVSLINDVLDRKLSGKGNLFFKGMSKPALLGFAIKLNGNVFDPQSFSVAGNLNIIDLDLHLNNDAKAKGSVMEPLKFFIPQNGKINLTVKQSKFNSGKLFRQSLQIANIKSVISWQQTKDGWQINATDVDGSNNDGTISGNGKFIIPNDDSSPLVDMLFYFDGQDVSRAPIYYPTGIMTKSLINWLDNAFPSGKGISGSLLLKGPLRSFPFDHDEGHFLINSDIHDVDLHYFPNWPNIEHIFGKLIFENRSMRIEANAGLINGVPLSHALVIIDNLANAVLKVDGLVIADSSDGLNFINSCPLKNTIGKYFEEMNLAGKMRLALKLSIPLAPASKDVTHVLGDINLQDNSLALPTWNMALHHLSGDVHFDENSISAPSLHGELFNRPLDLKISTETGADKSTITKVNFGGLLPVSLHDLADLDILKYARGNLNYQAELKLSKVNNEISDSLQITSDLKGVALSIPPLIKKSADTTEEFKAVLNFSHNKPLQLLVNYGNEVSAMLTLNRSDNKFKLLGGELHFGSGQATLQKEPGLFISGKLATVDWDDWKSYFLTKPKATQAQESAQPIIRKVDLLIGELKIFSQKLLDTRIAFTPSDNQYLLSITNANIAGSLSIPHNLELGTVEAKFDRLYLDSSETNLAKNKYLIKPQNIPNTNIVINDFRYGGKAFGRLALNAIAQKNVLAIQNLSLDSPLIKVNAVGNWIVENGISQSYLKGRFYSANLGETLRQWALTSSLVDGATNANFEIKWLGPIFDPGLKLMSGDVALVVNKGRIINIGEHAESEVGFGTVLNLLSLQTLPRRLTLDFSDLVKAGFSFDKVTGTINLRGGNATTYNTVLEGSVAQVILNGRIGLLAKDYNLKMTVFPHVTSSLPVIATIAGGPAGPAIGAATWLAEKLVISNVVKGMAHNVYHITGPWQNPNVEKIK